MNYIAQLCFKITYENTISGYDLQWRIIESDSLENALFSAQEFGRKESFSFINEKGIQVNWEFCAIPELYKINDFSNGGLLIRQHVEEKDADGYDLYIHRRSKDLAHEIVKNNLSFHL